MFILRIKRFINDRLVPCSCLGIRRNRDTPILLGYFRPPDTLRKHQAFRDIYSWKGTRLHAVNSRLYTVQRGQGREYPCFRCNVGDPDQFSARRVVFQTKLREFVVSIDSITRFSSIRISPRYDRKRSTPVMKKAWRWRVIG